MHFQLDILLYFYSLSPSLPPSCSCLFVSPLHRAIKLSSPKLSNITAVGCIFVYATVILLGLDHSTLPSAADSFATVCTVSYPHLLIILLLLQRAEPATGTELELFV